MLSFPAVGLWNPGEIHVSWTQSTRPNIPEVEQLIERAWQEASQRPGIHLFDGPMCRLESLEAREGSMHLTLSRTSYKPFLGTNLTNANLADTYGQHALANGIGLSALLLSSDGYLLLGRRNNSVAYYPGHVHPFSGSLEPSDKLDVFTDIRRELREELSLCDGDIESLVCTGIAMDKSIRQPEIIFAGRARLTVEQIESQLDRSEHLGIWSARVASKAVSVAVRNETGVTPVGIAALLLWGRIEFGDEWFAHLSPRV